MESNEVTDFYDKEIFKLTVINLTIIIRKCQVNSNQLDNYYPQVFLKECKYFEKKVVRHIHDSLSDFSYFNNESDEE